MLLDKKILIIFSVGLILRLLIYFLFINNHPERAFYSIDAYEYEFPAITLIEKGRYIRDCPKSIPEYFPGKCIPSNEPEIYRTPVYPLYIVLHYILFGYRSEMVIFSQNLIDSSKIFILFHISRTVGLVNPYFPSLLYALSPSALIFSQTFMTEAIQGFFLLLILFLLLKKTAGIKSALFGLTSGLLCLTHPIWLFFSLTLPLLFLIYSRSLKYFLISTFFLFLTVAPWMMRNWIIWHQVIFRHGSHVFLCEIYQRMTHQEWAPSHVDVSIFNEASERFGWGVKFSSEDEVRNFPINLTQELQIAYICRNHILKDLRHYPIELHFAGFVRSLPPFGIAHLTYLAKGDINPSRIEITKYVIPMFFEGKFVEVIREIKEKRLGLLSLFWWIFYIIGWAFRISSVLLIPFAFFKLKPKFSIMFFFVFVYALFLISTFESAQPRRFYTVEPIVFILSTGGVEFLRNFTKKSK